MKSNKILNLKNGAATVLGATTMIVTNCMSAFAGTSTGVPEVDKGLNIIKGLCIGVCAAVGVVGLVKGGIDLSSGISQRDQSGVVNGSLELAGGLVMAAIGTIIGLFGF
mgnify:CR=1 FL=1|jgi:hypothetical protein